MVGTSSDTPPAPSQSLPPAFDLSEFGIARAVGTSSALGNSSCADAARPRPRSRPTPSLSLVAVVDTPSGGAHAVAMYPRVFRPAPPSVRCQHPPQTLQHTSPSGPRCRHPDVPPLWDRCVIHASRFAGRPCCASDGAPWSQSPITQELSTGAVGPGVRPARRRVGRANMRAPATLLGSERRCSQQQSIQGPAGGRPGRPNSLLSAARRVFLPPFTVCRGQGERARGGALDDGSIGPPAISHSTGRTEELEDPRLLPCLPPNQKIPLTTILCSPPGYTLGSTLDAVHRAQSLYTSPISRAVNLSATSTQHGCAEPYFYTASEL
ncbi:hypothetical protein PHLGIDRAFT_118678 [Phlebiopsis gigantea 11061_1 CR5-6]|uniref:Uncharacterized protein n=1 Tax=Phlebiopsis gigantea (strain 11061_1 CR5-6) TaxID=745531 RepID=A0A0C3PKC1_PHLG1|nr:hypothetical protein PHLGIDRAFT_118678 [Phlebiopsis gigantea 11061_1 CR5-6]